MLTVRGGIPKLLLPAQSPAWFNILSSRRMNFSSVHWKAVHGISTAPAGCRPDWWQNCPCKKLTQWESQKGVRAKKLHTFLVLFLSVCSHQLSSQPSASCLFSQFPNFIFTRAVVPPRCDGKRELKSKTQLILRGWTPLLSHNIPPAFPCLPILSHCHNSWASVSQSMGCGIQGLHLAQLLIHWVLSAPWIMHIFFQLQVSQVAALKPLRHRQPVDLVKEFSGSKTPKWVRKRQPYFYIL